MGINIPASVKTVLNILHENGYQAHVVGGCVRDSIMGLRPNDWDVCTSALPEQIKECFKDFNTIDTGIKHGTVTIVVGKEQIETTTYRIDGEYKDNRHPESVTFTDDLVADLARRDFTINAMAYNDEDGIIDPFGGEADIRNKVIRCVGNPDDRFQEDALRILRAIRFASTLGFSIAGKTTTAMFNNKLLLKNISMERVNSEFTKTLNGKYYWPLLINFVEIFYPEINEDAAFEYGLIRTKYKPTINASLALLFDVDNYDEIMRRLKFTNRKIKAVGDIISLAGSNAEPNSNILHFAREILHANEQIYNDVVSYMRAKEVLGQRKEYAKGLVAVRDEAKASVYTIKGLAVKGNDMLSIGIEPVKIGKVLNYLLYLVMTDQIENTKETLLKEALNF